MPSEPRAGDDRVRHELENHRFVLSSGGAPAVLDYRVIDANTVEYHHTYVPPALRGRGIASRLAAHALRYALDDGLKVIPTCPFVAAYVRKHPDYARVLGR